jgi:hypothetical protein
LSVIVILLMFSAVVAMVKRVDKGGEPGND